MKFAQARKIAKIPLDKRLELHWRPHDSSATEIRVWRNNWFGDQFEVLSIAQFNMLSRFCTMFNIPLVDQTFDE